MRSGSWLGRTGGLVLNSAVAMAAAIAKPTAKAIPLLAMCPRLHLMPPRRGWRHGHGVAGRRRDGVSGQRAYSTPPNEPTSCE